MRSRRQIRAPGWCLAGQSRGRIRLGGPCNRRPCGRTFCAGRAAARSGCQIQGRGAACAAWAEQAGSGLPLSCTTSWKLLPRLFTYADARSHLRRGSEQR